MPDQAPDKASDNVLDRARAEGFGGAVAVAPGGEPLPAEATGVADERAGAPATSPAPSATLLAPAIAEAPRPGRWELWREDDNGNRYLVSVHEDEAAAGARLAAFEAGVVHKQRYWVNSVRVA